MKCKKCGKEIKENINDFIECPQKTIMQNKGYCFNCAFWDYQKSLINKDTIIVNGTKFQGSLISNEEKKKHSFLGFGGSDFYFKMLSDGSIRHYNNVWCQGEIPEIWKKDFPDNAIDVTINYLKN